jgi:hypothetical protein
MLISVLLAFQTLALLGMLTAGVNAFRRLCPLSPLPPALLWLICFGASATVLTWLGITGFFRGGAMAPAMGLAFAFYAIWYRRQYYALLRDTYRKWPYIVCFIAAIAVLAAIPKWCYLNGGINNTDEIRSITLTSAFAANYLKPAFVYNFSIPLSYSYNLYEISAFLYSIVSGYSWPSLTLLVTSTAAIIMFYLAYALFLHGAFPRRNSLTILVGLLSVTFFGEDIFVFEFGLVKGHMEEWNRLQVSQMATYHQWVYQYLLSMGFALGTLYALAEFCENLHRHWLYAAAACAGFALTFGAITGTWLIAAAVTFALFAIALNPRIILHGLYALPLILVIAVVILYPQKYTFIARDTILSFQAPSLWYNRIPLSMAHWSDWARELNVIRNEFGLLLTMGLLAIPFLAGEAFYKKQWGLLAAFSMCLASVLGMFFTATTAAAPDWFWRGGNLMLTVVASIGTVWVHEKLRNGIGRWLYILLPALLAPGIINYMVESKLRYQFCYPAPSVSRAINRSVDLNHVIVNSVYNKFDLLISGRSLYSNYVNDYTTTYRNYPYFLSRKFRYSPEQSPCAETRFGPALPDNILVLTTPQGGFIPSPCPRRR